MKWLIFFLVVLAAGLAVPYWLAGKDEVPMSEAARADAPGKFISVTDGQLHYQARGPENAPPVVMVHGFSTPSFIFEQNASSLAANGFRVIQFDHFGRGWSDRPKAVYDADFYDRELIELLDGLGIDQPVGLVGLSMGGVITAEFTARHPERVERLFLLVPTGLAVNGSDSLQTKMATAPIIGDWLWRVTAKRTLLGDDQYDEENLAEMNRLQGDVTKQMEYKGYFPALHATLRNLKMADRDELFVTVAETAKPVIAVFGENDSTIPVEAAERMRALMPVADVRVLSGGTHGLNYQDFDIINPWLVEFFSPMLPSPEPVPVASAITEPG